MFRCCRFITSGGKFISRIMAIFYWPLCAAVGVWSSAGADRHAVATLTGTRKLVVLALRSCEVAHIMPHSVAAFLAYCPTCVIKRKEKNLVSRFASSKRNSLIVFDSQGINLGNKCTRHPRVPEHYSMLPLSPFLMWFFWHCLHTFRTGLTGSITWPIVCE